MSAQLVRRAFGFVAPYRFRFAAGQAAMLTASLASLVFPMVSKYLIDSISSGVSRQGIYTLMTVLGGTFLVLAAANFVKDSTIGYISEHLVRDVRRLVFDKLQRLSMSYYDTAKSGDILSIVTNDLNLFQQAVSQGITFIITQILSLAVILVMLFRLDAGLTLVLIGIVPAVLLITRFMGSRVRKISTKVREKLGEVTSIMQETLRGIDVIKIYSLEEHAARIFERENGEAAREGVRSVKLNAVNNLFVGILAGTFIVLLCTIGSLHVADGRITLGDFVAYLIYAQMIIGPIGMLSGIYIEVQKAMAAVSRIFGILDLESEPEGGHTSEVGSGTGRRNREAVRIDDLSFSYEPGVRILEGISLSIAKGESVAFVGPSGAGKSTLLKLLLRFYESEKGAIRLFGRPLDEYEGSELRGKVAAVMQDTHLFDMSVRENILCGNPEASDRDVERAARAAHALRFIRDLPDGFETRLGENGVRLSGGQRQRISIARAFLKDPAILLLDEATASLDAEAERHIQSSLHRLMKRRTTIAIAHRLSTIRRVDRIFVMSEGTIIAQGTHESLMRECPLYAELCRHQMLG